jgi:hypothetical protein
VTGGLKIRDLYPSTSIIRYHKIKENEMGQACSTNGGEEDRVCVIGGNARRKETTRKTKT